MIDEEGFLRFLKKGGRTPSVARQTITIVTAFERYLVEQRDTGLDQAGAQDLEAYIAWLEREPKKSAKGHLHALHYYYEYTANEDLARLAGLLRQERIERAPFPLREFRGVQPEHIEKLEAIGVRNVAQMLAAGRTQAEREALARRAEIPETAVLELVKLSDLARIPGVKGIRARLYYDAGVDSVEQMARWEPEALRLMAADFVQRTGFEGIAPLPAEAKFTVAYAKKLPKVVE
jgi:Domain of unknown function (DUF4332)